MDEFDSGSVGYALDGASGVVQVFVSRPSRRNSMTADMWKQFESTIREIERSDARVVIISGTDGHFIAGSDLHELAQRTTDDGFSALAQRVTSQLATMRQATVAAINGDAIGGGLEVALACDLRVACETARFAFPELSLGMTPGAGASQRLGGLCGDGHAAELILTGRRFDAEEALALGVVGTVCRDNELSETVQELAQLLASRDWVALQATLIALRASRAGSLSSGYAIERMAQALNFSSGNPQHRVAEFLASKRL